jgi:hypothetical protein
VALLPALTSHFIDRPLGDLQPSCEVFYVEYFRMSYGWGWCLFGGHAWMPSSNHISVTVQMSAWPRLNARPPVFWGGTNFRFKIALWLPKVKDESLKHRAGQGVSYIR